MVVGDPFEFAVWFDIVPSWKFSSSVEGLYILCIDGNYLIKKKSIYVHSVIISGDGLWWSEISERIQELQGFDTSNYSNELLFMSADYPIYGFDYRLANEEYKNEALLEQIPNVDLTPMEVLDNGWKLYFFSDSINMKDVIIYAHTDEGVADVQRKEFDFRYIAKVVKEISEAFISKGL